MALSDEPIAKLGATVIDVNDLELEKTFWQAALGVEAGAEPDGYVFFKAREGRSGLTLQKVPESKTIKNRVHLDIEVPDLDTGITQLEALGAKVIQPRPTEGWQWVVMTDPEGNEFCVST
jgi:predicted enzyme related to lactoylglutathione lyase